MGKGADEKGKDILFFLSAILFVILLSNLLSAATRNCWSCGNCTAEIAAAAAGDIVQPNQSISVVSDVCITSADNIIFDCQGNSITGSGTNPTGFQMVFKKNNTIRNCNFSNLYQAINMNQANNITIFNNSISSTANYGIYSYFSNNVTIIKNNISSNTLYGVYTSFSNDMNISLNSFASNRYEGMYSSQDTREFISMNNFTSNGWGSGGDGGLYFAHHTGPSTISNNTFYNNNRGLNLAYSNNVTLNYNNMTNNSRSLFLEFASSLTDLTSLNISTTNTINGKPVYYWTNHNNDIINFSFNAGYVAVINSSNVTVRDLNLSYNGEGVFFFNTSNSRIINVTASNNYAGLQINAFGNFISLNNVIANNSINNNDYIGIALFYSDNTTLINNSINYNGLVIGSGGGINLAFNNKTVMKNNSLNNNIYGLYLVYNNNFYNLDIDTGNKINGKSIYYLINQANTIIDNSYNNDLGFLAFINSTNITIKDLYISSPNAPGILLGDVNRSRINNLTILYSYYGIRANNSNNNVFSNMTISNNASATEGIDCTYCVNNTLRNIFISASARAVYLTYSSNNYLDGIILANTSNAYPAFDTYYSNNTIMNNITSTGGAMGMSLYYSDNNIMTNSSFSNNSQYAVRLYSSSNNTLNNVIANNTFSGITYMPFLASGFAIYVSSNNTFTNVKSINNNGSGFTIWGDSDFNIINTSYIENNTQFAIYLSGITAENNLVYNNYIRNPSSNYVNSTDVSTNFFNISKISGTNIIGGGYLGGNFWAFFNNTGYSQTCTDADNDGICDTAYALDGVNYDYLPLYNISLVCIPIWTCNDWSTCSGGVQNRTCTDIYSCNSTMNQPTSSQFCTTSGGATTQQSSTTETQIIGTISSGGSVSVDIKSKNIDIRNITINANKNISNASITISKTPNEDIIPRFTSGVIYQVFNINAKAISNENLNNVTMEFRVNKTWLAQQNYSYNNVILYRVSASDSLWQALTTVSIREDSTYYYFLSISPGFSTFIIFIGAVECIPEETRCFNEEIQFCSQNNTWVIQEKCAYSCENGKCVNASLFNLKINPTIIYTGIIIGIFATIMVIFYLIIKNIPRKESSHTSKKLVQDFSIIRQFINLSNFLFYYINP